MLKVFLTVVVLLLNLSSIWGRSLQLGNLFKKETKHTLETDKSKFNKNARVTAAIGTHIYKTSCDSGAFEVVEDSKKEFTVKDGVMYKSCANSAWMCRLNDGFLGFGSQYVACDMLVIGSKVGKEKKKYTSKSIKHPKWHQGQLVIPLGDDVPYFSSPCGIGKPKGSLENKKDYTLESDNQEKSCEGSKWMCIVGVGLFGSGKKWTPCDKLVESKNARQRDNGPFVYGEKVHPTKSKIDVYRNPCDQEKPLRQIKITEEFVIQSDSMFKQCANTEWMCELRAGLFNMDDQYVQCDEIQRVLMFQPEFQNGAWAVGTQLKISRNNTDVFNDACNVQDPTRQLDSGDSIPLLVVQSRQKKSCKSTEWMCEVKEGTLPDGTTGFVECDELSPISGNPEPPQWLPESIDGPFAETVNVKSLEKKLPVYARPCSLEKPLRHISPSDSYPMAGPNKEKSCKESTWMCKIRGSTLEGQYVECDKLVVVNRKNGNSSNAQQGNPTAAPRGLSPVAPASVNGTNVTFPGFAPSSKHTTDKGMIPTEPMEIGEWREMWNQYSLRRLNAFKEESLWRVSINVEGKDEKDQENLEADIPKIIDFVKTVLQKKNLTAKVYYRPLIDANFIRILIEDKEISENEIELFIKENLRSSQFSNQLSLLNVKFGRNEVDNSIGPLMEYYPAEKYVFVVLTHIRISSMQLSQLRDTFLLVLSLFEDSVSGEIDRYKSSNDTIVPSNIDIHRSHDGIGEYYIIRIEGEGEGFALEEFFELLNSNGFRKYIREELGAILLYPPGIIQESIASQTSVDVSQVALSSLNPENPEDDSMFVPIVATSPTPPEKSLNGIPGSPPNDELRNSLNAEGVPILYIVLGMGIPASACIIGMIVLCICHAKGKVVFKKRSQQGIYEKML